MRFAGITASLLPMLFLLGMASAVRPNYLGHKCLGQENTTRSAAYQKAVPTNAISRLQTRIDNGEVKLVWGERGYLDSLLKELRISPHSQVLVFSKTSLQVDKISPRTPRAIYFNEDIYVGWCVSGTVIEISIADPVWGGVFYTLPQRPVAKPKIQHQTYDCLQCHQSALTQNIPGHTMRSVYTLMDGMPDFSAGSKITNDQSPLDERWGGWYVSGRHGKMRHMGNVFAQRSENFVELDRNKGANTTRLQPFFETNLYKTPHSDIAALMVLAHQTSVHNAITKANFDVQDALASEKEMNAALGETGRRESTTRRIATACEPLLETLLFSGEAFISAPIIGTTPFETQFSAQAPANRKDKWGRSLYQIDLTKRLMRYPCSYLIYSESFNALPQEAKDYLYLRLRQVLQENNNSTENNTKFAHLTPKDRTAIWEILCATKPEVKAHPAKE
jgi:hypothetical protein